MKKFSAKLPIFYAATSLSALVLLAGCQGGADSLFPKAERPIPDKLVKAMKAKGMTNGSPLLIRIFKEESSLEVWKKKDTGRYGLLQTYEICQWSGKLGPKFKEGDRQAPEGFLYRRPGANEPEIAISFVIQHGISQYF